ncbi:hypothetical protein OFN93_01365 [Campylobacter sp. CN_NE4]|uniref:hypothetical protein n=1 Tax=unclassified Campylobacter TaxID=2593542 RepID=UPI0022E9C3D0|nr:MULTISPECIES: hypothetical protein [unclassified Campylobacter]MDA3064931.1 hypothetical protein [Campylobacter sp. CN_NE4]MDA3068245.1 hypothetical protein [Campylobacter sp. CN_NE3]MDA3084077.1 hypothetical protein [Campylobacter sp. CN_NE1]WBR52293.1 hypothetical protein PF028_05035 [Campylobacter sp. CN_NE2]
MENDIKQRAEQLKKNAEAKIQKAQIKEQKYQQDLEFQKKNNPNFRDYDKDPLIIQSYEEFFVLTLLVSSFIFACIFAGILQELRWGKVPQELLWLSLIPVSYIIIIAVLQKFKFKNHKIKFTNHYIEFYDYGKLKRKCKISHDELARTFFVGTGHFEDFPIYFKCFLFIIFILFVIIAFLPSILFCFINLIIKFLSYFFINCSLKGFKIFPFLRIAKSHHTVPMYGALLSARYFMIYLYSDEIYKEVKQYFLQKNINIDHIKKSYELI